jgi:D-alanyl-lipoteichoic acid acyltransferase DltB (MBOAT superfamily)
MLFPTIGFTVFFLLVLTLWPMAHTPAARARFLALASGLFCAIASPGLLLYVLAWSALLTIAGARRERGAQVALVGLALLQLVFWKAFEAVPRGILPAAVAQWAVPLGVSFFTFQGLTYLFARMRGTLEAPWRFEKVFAFCAFFPTIFSGPILRAPQWSEQLDAAPVPLEAATVSRAMSWAVLGLAYKLVLATLLGDIVDAAWSDPAEQPAATLWLAAYAYAFQLYADFAGYSLLALAIALLLGFTVPANFDQPYLATSVQAFWRRWHISFSSWLRDYLYIGLLGGNAHGRVRQVGNVLVTFFLCGAWHGLALHYLIWGVWQAVAVAYSTVSRMLLGAPAARSRPATAVHWLVAFHVVVLGWVWFRAPSASAAVDYFAAMAGGWSWQPEYLAGLLLVALALAVHLAEKRLLGGMERIGCALPGLGQVVFWGAALIAVLALSPAGLPPFIYFKY